MRLPADGQDVETAGGLKVGVLLLDRRLGDLEQVRVERAGQPAVRRHHDHEHAADGLALLEEWVLRRVELAAQMADHLADLERERARGEDALLRLPQLCRRHHLHGARDLLRVLNRADPAADVSERGHGRGGRAKSEVQSGKTMRALRPSPIPLRLYAA